MILTDEKLKEFAHPHRGNDAKKLMASELLTLREQKRKLVEAGNKLYHDLYAMRTHKSYEPFTCETVWEALMKEVE